MWQSFAEEARHSVFAAEEQAVLLSSVTVEPEHFLLAFAEMPASRAMRMLQAAPVPLEEMRARLITPDSWYPRPPKRKDMVLGTRAKSLIDIAYQVADTRKDKLIGTEHLLYALVKQGQGPAAAFLIEAGANLARLQEVWNQL